MSCPFKVGDILVPKEPDFYEQKYGIKYRVKEIHRHGMIIEPVIERRYIEEICSEVSRRIYELNCSLPRFISVDVKCCVDERIDVWDFEWDEFERR